MKLLLLVDDDELVLKAVARALKRKLPKWEIHQCNVSGIAIYCASRQSYRAEDREQTNYHPRRFDVVVSDYQMPGHNGLDVLEEFAKHSPKTLRVMSSGLGVTDIARRDSRADTVVDLFYDKPLDIDRFVDTLKRRKDK